jgi:hypothetical protein
MSTLVNLALPALSNGEYQLWQILTLAKMKLIKSNLDNISFSRFQHWQKLNLDKVQIW